MYNISWLWKQMLPRDDLIRMEFMHQCLYYKNCPADCTDAKSNETPTWCNTVQVLFLQSHSTCFGRQAPNHQEYLKLVRRPLVRVLSLSTITHVPVAAVIVLNTPDDGRLRPKHVEWLCRNREMWWLTCNDNTCTSGRCNSFKYSWWWALAPETCRVTLQK